MKTVRSVTAAAVAAAMLATSVTPAMAQGYPGGGYGYPGGYGGGHGRERHRDHDRIGAGGIIAGIAVLGVIAAIASSGSKNRNNGGYDGGYRGGINTENEAADACANAVEQQGGYRVTGIDTVERTRDGYSVRGTLNTRSGGSWGYGRNQQQGFYCAVRDGSIADVRVDNGNNTYRGY